MQQVSESALCQQQKLKMCVCVCVSTDYSDFAFCKTDLV